MTDLQPLSPEEGTERFLEHREVRLRDSSLQNARTRMETFLEWCELEGIDELSELSGRRLDEFVRWRQGQVKPLTLQKQLSTYRQALRYWADIEAVQDGLDEKLHAPELPDGAEARDTYIKSERAQFILKQLDRYHFASRGHAILAGLWRTAMRRGELHSIDVDDLDESERAVKLRHRPETGTQLKNGPRGERDVYLGPTWFKILDEYANHPDRPDVTDEYSRRPLFTTGNGRMHPTSIYDIVNRWTQPCRYGDCPHERDPPECRAYRRLSESQKCPSSHRPHNIRRGRITHDLNQQRPPEAVSKRADVSLEVLERHYNAQTKREKMNVRKRHFEE